ncbi:MAG: right-handed parallel beta-helix repeat-containing protein [Acidobacteriota bacterium]|nr:right-handed parallel beta-helix repeat-containing protein [Acidobacteriota bacterium]
MKVVCLASRLVLLCLAVSALHSVAQAQFIIRFVASTGNDANPCTRPAPCRSMQRGVDATPDGSELQVIDNAGYGPNVTITKNITISADGVQATVATVSGIGIHINAPGATVRLRHLRLMGAGATQAGIRVTDAASVRIENCVIDGFGNAGISYDVQAGSQLHITDTISSNNGAGGLHVFGPQLVVAGRVGAQLALDAATVSVSGSKFLHNDGNGVNFDTGFINASITDSVMSGNSFDGVRAGSPSATASCDRCTAADNGQDGFLASNNGALTVTHSVARGNSSSGMEARGGGRMRVSDSAATDNDGFGFRQRTGGTFETIGNNLVSGNGTDVSGTVNNIGGV